jgi:hypothetical protein
LLHPHSYVKRKRQNISNRHNTRRRENRQPDQGILRGEYHCTIDLLFDWFGLVCFSNKSKFFSFHTAYSKPVKQEVNGTVILPPSVFPDQIYKTIRCIMLKEQHIFELPFIIEGTAEKPPKSLMYTQLNLKTIKIYY